MPKQDLAQALQRMKAETVKLDKDAVVQLTPPAPRQTDAPISLTPREAPTAEDAFRAFAGDKAAAEAELGDNFDGMDQEHVAALRLSASKQAQEKRANEQEELQVDDVGEVEEVGEQESASGEDADEQEAQSRALLIAVGKIPAKIVKTLSADAVAALAVSIQVRSEQNTAASQDAGDSQAEVATAILLPKPADLVKEFSEHFDADAAAALGKTLEKALTPAYAELQRLAQENQQLKSEVLGSRGRSMKEQARAALLDRCPQLRDPQVYQAVEDIMQGGSNTHLFKGRAVNQEGVNDLMLRAARFYGLDVIDPKQAREAVAAKKRGQPHVGGALATEKRMGEKERFALEFKAAQLFSAGRDQDAHAVIAGIQ